MKKSWPRVAPNRTLFCTSVGHLHRYDGITTELSGDRYLLACLVTLLLEFVSFQVDWGNSNNFD